MTLTPIYRPGLALLTDLYQLTMAAGYFEGGLAGKETTFHLFFRKHPFGGGFTIFSGLAQAVDYMNNFRFEEEDLTYLASLTGNDGQPLFKLSFIDYLREMKFTCDVDAISEGSVVFPHQPLLRLSGPIIQCQLLETALLNIVNFQTLIATKTARIVAAAKGDPVLEFGLRRAQGFDGALSAARAAFVGGCAGTSNVLAGRLFDMPVRGTHAHSWVMAFDGEVEAFETYAAVMPNNCIFLVDTYDTLEGVRNAIGVARRLRERGHEMLGIRLDSGDLATLSIQARQLLDEGGFPDARIVASNDLDEYAIASLKSQGARIDMWGVGTKLATAYDQPALGGVYKLGAIRTPGESWQYRLKRSEDAIKASNPGILQVARLQHQGRLVGDVIYDIEQGFDQAQYVPYGSQQPQKLPEYDQVSDLLGPLFRQGRFVAEDEEVAVVRQRAQTQVAALPECVTRLENPDVLPQGLEPRLSTIKQRLLLN